MQSWSPNDRTRLAVGHRDINGGWTDYKALKFRTYKSRRVSGWLPFGSFASTSVRLLRNPGYRLRDALDRRDRYVAENGKTPGADFADIDIHAAAGKRNIRTHRNVRTRLDIQRYARKSIRIQQVLNVRGVTARRLRDIRL